MLRRLARIDVRKSIANCGNLTGGLLGSQSQCFKINELVLSRFGVFVVLALGFLVSCTDKQGQKPANNHWSAGSAPSSLDLLSVSAVDAEYGWAVGDIDPGGAGGAIYRTTDGGKSWNVVSRTSDVFAGVHFTSRTRGWIAGYAGTIKRTDDGGKTWILQRGGSMMETRQPEREAEVLNSIFFLDDRHGWATGGSGLILRTSNGGDTWEPVDAGRVEDLWAVRFASVDRGWIVGEDGLILTSRDGGQSWQALTPGKHITLYSLAVVEPSTVIVVGAGGTILRSEDGANWNSIPSNTSEILNSVASAGKEVFWAVGSGGTTLGSFDEGRSWVEVVPVSRRDLNSVSLADAAHGIAVGRRGAVQQLTSGN
jgi:photosystem II stability/assembly factor-like uncharacterized protein